MLFHDFALGHIEVEVQGRAYDLHNFYQAEPIRYDVTSRTLALHFRRWPEPWVPPEEPEAIDLLFSGVSYFSADGRDCAWGPEDDRCLHAIGVVPQDAATSEFYLSDDFPAAHHLVIEFQSGLILRLQAEEARCSLRP
ncbi:hypothetical protein [Pseudomonas sp. KCJK8993]|uniref:hypothetical protein n=1 Tax=Pseudomonas sp. KCJK8993 TaxID=3344565 RepID=UPI003905926D